MTDTKEMPGEVWCWRSEGTDRALFICAKEVEGYTQYIRADRYAQNLITETKALRDLLDAKDEDTAHFSAADLERVRDILRFYAGLPTGDNWWQKVYADEGRQAKEALALLERKEKT